MKGKLALGMLILLMGLGCSLRLEPALDPFYGEVLKGNPEHRAAIYANGQDLITQGRYQEAIPYFEKLADLEPDQVGGWLGWGQCCLELGDYDQAADLFEQANTLRPTLQGMVGIASSQLMLGEADKAALLSVELENRFGPTAELYRLRGDMAYVKQDLEAAQGYYERSLELKPGQKSLITRLGDIQAYQQSLSKP